MHRERLNSKWGTPVIPRISEFKDGQVMPYGSGTKKWEVLI